MPVLMDDDVSQFRTDTIVDFFTEMTEYSASLGIRNSVCVMLGSHWGINLDSLDRICSLPHLENIGSDPYWIDRSHPERTGAWVYKFPFIGEIVGGGAHDAPQNKSCLPL